MSAIRKIGLRVHRAAFGRLRKFHQLPHRPDAVWCERLLSGAQMPHANLRALGSDRKLYDTIGVEVTPGLVGQELSPRLIIRPLFGPGQGLPRSAVSRPKGGRSSGPFIANCSGVKSPSELCGRSVLYSMRHCSITRRAWAIVRNQCSFRHSSRKRPLKLSMYAFSIGFPGRMRFRAPSQLRR